jgi:hypothetical protein
MTTTNQLIAMGFPLLTAAAVGLTGLFIRKPWAEKAPNYDQDYDAEIVAEVEIGERPVAIGNVMTGRMVFKALDHAEDLIREAQQEIRRAKRPALTPRE